MNNLVTKSLRIIRNEGLFPFLKKISYRVMKPILIPYFIYKLQQERLKINKLEDLVDFVFNFQIDGLNITPSQIKEEILKLLKILEKIKPKTILEIGTANGGTLFLFSQIASPDAIIISIDLHGGKFGGGYPIWKVPLYKSFAKDDQKIYLIRADSHDEKTLEKVKNMLGKRKLDFLFIDGDHTYEGVKKDFEMYSKFVKRGGIIALHDIVYHPFDPECQVDKFWRKLKKLHKTKEIISFLNQTWAGIGLVFP
jgi:predicted O-methyltransferase YrrM